MFIHVHMTEQKHGSNSVCNKSKYKKTEFKDHGIERIKERTHVFSPRVCALFAAPIPVGTAVQTTQLAWAWKCVFVARGLLMLLLLWLRVFFLYCSTYNYK